MKDSELVSIITPTYNCSTFIEKTIESVLSQSYKNWELIIVDDCSTDDTRYVVERYKDSRIRYHCLYKNSGAAVARNKALELAKGRWIAFLDSDDLWKPQKLEKQLNFMMTKGIHFSYHEYEEIDEEGNPIGVMVSGKKKVNKFDMFTCCWPGCLTVMYDADKIGLLQIEDIKKNNDTAIWLQAIKKANCYLFKENLALYRRRKGSITPSDIKTKIKWLYILFHDGEKMAPLSSFLWTCMNLMGMAYKKLFFIKKFR